MSEENREDITKTLVTYDEFKKLDMRIGTVRFVEPIPETDKLLRFLIDFGRDVATSTYTDDGGNEYPVRQIVSGIREYYPDYQRLVGRQLLYVINLEPRMIRGITSEGMLMAVGDSDCVFLVPDRAVDAGSAVH